MKRPIPDSYWVVPNALLTGGYLWALSPLAAPLPMRFARIAELRRDCPDGHRRSPETRLPYFPQPFRSTWSFAFAAAVVCHCMLVGASAPPQASGVM
jgi:hypothetical protein